MSKQVKRIISMARHRNGVGGNPFVVTLFESYGSRDAYVAISMAPECTDPSDKQRRDFIDNTAVLRVADLIAGDVSFGVASLSGSDTWGRDIADAYDKRTQDEFGFPAFLQETPA